MPPYNSNIRTTAPQARTGIACVAAANTFRKRSYPWKDPHPNTPRTKTHSSDEGCEGYTHTQEAIISAVSLCDETALRDAITGRKGIGANSSSLDLNKIRTPTGQSLLHAAVSSRQPVGDVLGVTRCLLGLKADPNSSGAQDQEETKETPLFAATARLAEGAFATWNDVDGSSAIVRALVDANADVLHKDEKGRTAADRLNLATMGSSSLVMGFIATSTHDFLKDQEAATKKKIRAKTARALARDVDNVFMLHAEVIEAMGLA
mmetsp:Transcript_14017/g.28355  ORF Transcript_14017/g.28355 Transcript_14017/m.28355 type:complete len:263 (+) Transcript_14017:91-879(+)